MAEEQVTTDIEPQRPAPPRVALIASRRTISEYPLYLKFLLVGLADESVPVVLVCPPGSEVESIVPPTVEVIRHPALDMPLMEHYNRHQLLNRLVEFRPDVLHCLCEMTSALTRWLSGRLKIRYLININSIAAHRRLITLSSSRCANIIVPAKTIAEHFTAAHPKFADRVRQINIGAFVESETACFARPQCLPGIVIAPPIENGAGLDNLFQALYRLTIDSYQFIVALVGGGRWERQVFRQLRSLGLLRVVTIVPRTLGLFSAVSAADVFIVPRPSNSYNMLLLAAMGAGSVVASCTGGVDDLIIEDKTALVFNPDDQLSIYNTLKRIFDSREMARKIASNAQEYLRQNHKVSDKVASTLQLYRQTSSQAEQTQTQTESNGA
jgi:glycosyltransferase involved in cell wall biosynthesis